MMAAATGTATVGFSDSTHSFGGALLTPVGDNGSGKRARQGGHDRYGDEDGGCNEGNQSDREAVSCKVEVSRRLPESSKQLVVMLEDSGDCCHDLLIQQDPPLDVGAS